MKKLIAFVLAVIMMAAVSVPAFAVSEMPAALEHYGANKALNEGENSGEVEVHYEVKSKYEVRIPENLAFADSNGYKFIADVEARNVIIGMSQSLLIELTSANNYKMIPVGEGKEGGVPYSVYYSQNTEHVDDLGTKDSWPGLEEKKSMLQILQTKIDPAFTEAGVTEGKPEGKDYVVVTGGGYTEKLATTLAFFLPETTNSLGHYVDVLTFTVDITGDVDAGVDA